MEEIVFKNKEGCVGWIGVSLDDNATFNGFLTSEVSDRVQDQEGLTDLTEHLRGLVSTGFESDSLNKILDADIPEERCWAVGEAFAEAWLNKKHNIVWPWNMERDKRTPLASLPGADLVGFIEIKGTFYLTLGEVKTSSEDSSPPNVMYGRSGMTNQLDKLASNLGLLSQLIKWLWPRCRNTPHQKQFDSAVKALISSENKAIYLFGILIRDTSANESDLKSRGEALSKALVSPTNCSLTALYLPFAVSELSSRVMNEDSP